jgi:transposase-like protein
VETLLITPRLQWSGKQEYFMVKLKKKVGVAKRVRRQHTGAFKAQVALAALREDKTMAQLCQEFDLHANQITEWKRQLLERAADVFGGADPPKPVDLQPLHAKIGQLTLENDFLERALTKAGLLSAR